MNWFWRAAKASAIGSGVFCGILLLLIVVIRASGFWNVWLVPVVLAGFVFSHFLAAVLYGDKDPDAETRCSKCGYILRGITEPRCPECGEKI